MSVAFESPAAVAPLSPLPAQRATAPLRQSELFAALSHALDLAEGEPAGHAIRCAWIGMGVGQAIGLAPHDRRDLLHAILLKDLGGSANAARIATLYRADDLAFKHDHRVIGDSLPQALRFALTRAGSRSGLVERLQGALNVAVNGGEIAPELVAGRSERGAEIARRLHCPESVAEAIRCLDEHWDGRGQPAGVAGEDIPLFARIALLAEVAEVFHTSAGREAAVAEVRRRSGTWLDPWLTAAFEKVAAGPEFWEMLSSPEIEDAILDPEPADFARPVGEEYLDVLAAAFAAVADAKSAHTAGHSARVADYCAMIADELGMPETRRRWLRRAALLHDIGKLGVPNTILDKPGRLTAEEWAVMRGHAAASEAILSRVPAFRTLARVAGAHHECLDGSGYPRGLKGDGIALDTRAIAVADAFDVLTTGRPYRDAMPTDQAFAVLAKGVGTAFDRRCFGALRSAVVKRRMFESL